MMKLKESDDENDLIITLTEDVYSTVFPEFHFALSYKNYPVSRDRVIVNPGGMTRASTLKILNGD
jgi:hypothetical protein